MLRKAAVWTCRCDRGGHQAWSGARGLHGAATAASPSASSPYDVCVVGGGIVGLACAREILRRHPQRSVIVLEKEAAVGRHQTLRNSGVIHAGIYYQPGSFRAKLCVQGAAQMYQYCREKNLPYKKAGKLIVAVTPEEATRLDEYLERGRANQVAGLQMLNAEQITQLEPRIRGLKALLSPETGITDFNLVARAYAADIRAAGGTVRTNFHVDKLQRVPNGVKLVSSSSSSSSSLPVEARHVLACCGLHSDRFAQLSGGRVEPRIIGFRGTWFKMKPQFASLVAHNIYPVANPAFPFLGVHFTPTVHGDLLVGPNAALAFAREGYHWSKFSFTDTGLENLLYKHWRFALQQVASEIFPNRTVKLMQQYMPSFRSDMLQSNTLSGVRAQAIGPDGSLLEDFIFAEERFGSGRVLHVRNAPSPAATASLAIAQHVVDKAQNVWNWQPTATATATASAATIP